jgi:amidase
MSIDMREAVSGLRLAVSRRRHFLLSSTLPFFRTAALSTLLVGVLALTASAQAKEFDLQTATLADIQDAMDAGALTSEKLVQLYLKRIEAYDKKGPKVNAMISVNPKALQEARVLDAERKAKGPRSPLHGVPVVFKDLIDVAGQPTTAGFKPFGAPVPLRDATIVAKLRAAGAVMLGKASTTNWFGRGFGDTHPIGASLNPYNLAHSPGGSSNGSGVAMAAYFAALAVGTDTSVSVQSPASNCSVVGMVGTYGMVSRAGIVPRGATQDRPGPIGRSVSDVAAMFSVMSGWDAEDLTTFNPMGHFPQSDWSKELKSADLKGRRIGILKEMIPSGPTYAEGLAIFDQALEDMRKAGAYIVPISVGNPSISHETSQARLRTAEYEKIHYQNAYLARLGPAAKFKSMQEMIQRVGAEKFSDGMIRALQLPPPGESPDYEARQRTRQMYIDLIADTMEKYQLDVLVQPFTAVPPPELGGVGEIGEVRPQRDPNDPFGGNTITSSLGLPAVVVAGGYTPSKKLPIAIQFFSKPFDDLKVLKAAHGYEQISKRRKTPASTAPLPGERFEYRNETEMRLTKG